MSNWNQTQDSGKILRIDQIHKYWTRLGAGCRKIWFSTLTFLFFKLDCQWDEIRVRPMLGTPKLKEPQFMNRDYPFIKKFKQLWNLWHKYVKWSNMKMSRWNIRNEPVWLKNIRSGTQDLYHDKYALMLSYSRLNKKLR